MVLAVAAVAAGLKVEPKRILGEDEDYCDQYTLGKMPTNTKGFGCFRCASTPFSI